MSHVAECKTRFKYLDMIAKAAQRLGGELIKGQKTYKWYGRWVGDTPMPKGMTLADLGKCDHAIRFPSASYEVGVRAQKDGTFTLAWDWWSGGRLLPVMGDTDAGRFKQAYGIETAKREAIRKGYHTREVAQSNGDIQLEMLVH